MARKNQDGLNSEEDSTYSLNLDKPVKYFTLKNNAVESNPRFKELHEKFFPTTEITPELKDLVRTTLIINNLVIHARSGSEEDSNQIITSLQGLTKDKNVFSFLTHHFTQNVFTFAGVDNFMHAFFKDGVVSMKLETCAAIFESENNGEVSCRIIIYGFHLTNIEDPEIKHLDTTPDKPNMVFDTTFIVSSAIVDDIPGAKITVKEHYEGIYSPDFEKKIHELHPALTAVSKSLREKVYLHALNNPKSQINGATLGAVMPIITLLAIKSIFSEGIINQVASTLLRYNTFTGFLGLSAMMTVSSAFGQNVYMSLITYINEIRTRRKITDYKGLIKAIAEENNLVIPERLASLFDLVLPAPEQNSSYNTILNKIQTNEITLTMDEGNGDKDEMELPDFKDAAHLTNSHVSPDLRRSAEIVETIYKPLFLPVVENKVDPKNISDEVNTTEPTIKPD